MVELTDVEKARLKELTTLLNHVPAGTHNEESTEFDVLMAKKYDVEDARVLYIGNT